MCVSPWSACISAYVDRMLAGPPAAAALHSPPLTFLHTYIHICLTRLLLTCAARTLTPTCTGTFITPGNRGCCAHLHPHLPYTPTPCMCCAHTLTPTCTTTFHPSEAAAAVQCVGLQRPAGRHRAPAERLPRHTAEPAVAAALPAGGRVPGLKQTTGVTV